MTKNLLYFQNLFQGQIAVIGGVDPLAEPSLKKDKVLLLPAGMKKATATSRSRSLKLAEITHALPPSDKTAMMLKAAQRIMRAELGKYCSLLFCIELAPFCFV